MLRPLANSSVALPSVVPLIIVLFALAGLTLTGACGGESRCTNSEQCADGFACNPESQQCESVAGNFDAGPDAVPGPDANQVCPEETHFCATPAPEGWSGPVIGTEVASDAELSACPAAFGAAEQVVFDELVASGACSCACPGASGVTCSPAILTPHQGSGAAACSSSLCPACAVLVPATGTCEAFSQPDIQNAEALNVSLGQVTSPGTCGAPITSDDLSAEFAGQGRYCSTVALQASCPAAGSCLPNAVDETFDSVCVFQAGDLECPSEYPEKRLRFEGIEDTRSCSSCTCSGPAVDSSCGGIVDLGLPASSGCTTASASGGCVSKPANQSIAASYTPQSEFACSQSGAELTGEATATGPVTFCCLTPSL